MASSLQSNIAAAGAAAHEITMVVKTQVKFEPDRPVNPSTAVGTGVGIDVGSGVGA